MTAITHRHGADPDRPGAFTQVLLLLTGRGRIVRRGPAPGQDTSEYLLSGRNRDRLLRSVGQLDLREGREHTAH